MKNDALSPNGEVCIEVNGLWKIFGQNAEEIIVNIIYRLGKLPK